MMGRQHRDDNKCLEGVFFTVAAYFQIGKFIMKSRK